MSQMIKCDSCDELYFADSRTDKSAYWLFTSEGIDGHKSFHLCKDCLVKFRKEFLHYTDEKLQDDGIIIDFSMFDRKTE